MCIRDSREVGKREKPDQEKREYNLSYGARNDPSYEREIGLWEIQIETQHQDRQPDHRKWPGKRKPDVGCAHVRKFAFQVSLQRRTKVLEKCSRDSDGDPKEIHAASLRSGGNLCGCTRVSQVEHTTGYRETRNQFGVGV